jgi:Fe-S-cluster-containing dehydrogenase component
MGRSPDLRNTKTMDTKSTYRWGMVIDLDKCTGCQACVVACRQENNISFAGEKEAKLGRAKLWMNLVSEVEGHYPNVKMHFLPIPCMQCDRPPCTMVCPVAATYKNPEGIVAQVYPRCIGVRMCISNCPYTVRYFNWYEPIRRAKENAKKEKRRIREGEVVPACVGTCPSEALYFGDLNDPKSQIAKLSKSRRAFRLMEELGTEPKVYYLKEGEWDDG